MPVGFRTWFSAGGRSDVSSRSDASNVALTETCGFAETYGVRLTAYGARSSEAM